MRPALCHICAKEAAGNRCIILQMGHARRVETVVHVADVAGRCVAGAQIYLAWVLALV
jgi:hypothetical protein